MTGGRPVVRELDLSEVGFRIDYFHDASDEFLQTLGVDIVKSLRDALIH